jgi:hypothetical protein
MHEPEQNRVKLYRWAPYFRLTVVEERSDPAARKMCVLWAHHLGKGVPPVASLRNVAVASRQPSRRVGCGGNRDALALTGGVCAPLGYRLTTPNPARVGCRQRLAVESRPGTPRTRVEVKGFRAPAPTATPNLHTRQFRCYGKGEKQQQAMDMQCWFFPRRKRNK